MIWRTQAARLALLELVVRGALRRRQAQADAWDALDELPWTRRTGRRDEIGIVEPRRHEVVALLERVWSEWADVLVHLTARGLPPTPVGWRAFEDDNRHANLPPLPPQVNRRTVASLLAPHSKASLTGRRLAALGSAEATHDGLVRLRPPAGLSASTAQGVVDLSATASVLGEACLPERALHAGFALDGPIRAAVLVENLGTFCDLPALDGWLIVHVPGWNTRTVARLLGYLKHVPVAHFGDLDPNGVRIFQHLRKLFPALHWFIPAFWSEVVESKGLPCAWPEDLDTESLPALVRELAGRGLWLEQEAITVDPRIRTELGRCVESDPDPASGGPL